MNAWRAVIVDDEPPARQTLRMLLARETDFVVAAECGHGREAIDAIAAMQPDVLFLDVRMPGHRRLRRAARARRRRRAGGRLRDRLRSLRSAGLRAARRRVPAQAVHRRALRRRRRPRTAAAARARAGDARRAPAGPAGDAGAARPIGGSSSSRTARARTSSPRPTSSGWRPRTTTSRSTRNGRAHPGARVAEDDRGAARSREVFARVHRSAIVNTRWIKAIEPVASGDQRLVLTDGTVLRVSRTHRAALMRRL